MLERPDQGWDDYVAEYLVAEHTAKGMDELETPKRGGCLTALVTIVLLIVAAIVLL